MIAAYRARRDTALRVLDQHGLASTYVEPTGAFYLLVDCGSDDSPAFCRRLLAERHVAVAPGGTFGDVAKRFI
jgi:aspartate aminotransferase